MAETPLQERTEAATPRRRQETHRAGRVPRSAELTTAALLLGSALALQTSGLALGRGMVGVMGQGLGTVGAGALDGPSAVALLRGVGEQTLTALLPLLLTLSLLALAVTAVQARGVLSLQPLAPSWSRIDPAVNARRIFGAQAWVELLKALLKVVILGVAIHLSLAAVWSDSLALVQESPFALLRALRTHSVRLLTTAGLAYLAFAALDYLYQVWRFERELRMTRDEVREEKRQEEGDPMMRVRLRGMGQVMMRGPAMHQVARADLVVVAEGIAVALEYDPAVAEAPVVLAVGRQRVAARMAEVARQAGVPLHQDGALARALLDGARVGAAIPPEHYIAVAEALARSMAGRAARAGGEAA